MKKTMMFLALGALLMAVSAGCDKMAETGKKAARKTGHAVGSGAAEFFNGVGNGIDEASDKIKKERANVVYAICESDIKDGCLDKFLAEVAKVVPKVSAEKGCIFYTPLVDWQSGLPRQEALRPMTVTVIECWESMEAVNAHLAQPHMAAFRDAVKDLRASSRLRFEKAVAQ